MSQPLDAHEAGQLSFGEDGHEFGGSVPKLATGIAGFDDMSMGGVPARRATVIAGQAGSGKTVLAGHFLAEGVRRGQPAVFVSLEESARDLRDNLATLGFDIHGWEERGDWRFVDASPVVGRDEQGRTTVSPYQIDTLLAQIGHAVDATGAERLVLDSLNGVLSLHDDPRSARSMVRRMVASMRSMGVTVMLTVETPDDPGSALSRYGVEEFVADNVVLLHHRSSAGIRRRTIEILKMRGAMHHKGEVSFTVLPGQGVQVLPMVRMHTGELVEPQRISSGSPDLDRMVGGGLFSGAALIVSGPTGIGKTMLATQFIGAGLSSGARCLHIAYEESRDQVLRSAGGWGVDYLAAEAAGLLRIHSAYPDAASLDDHLVEIESFVRRDQPVRVTVDSLSALERLGSPQAFREFCYRMTATMKAASVTLLLTANSRSGSGPLTVTDSNVSALADGIVLMRYSEAGNTLQRELGVLKMRGTAHDLAIRPFAITGSGLQMLGDA